MNEISLLEKMAHCLEIFSFKAVNFEMMVNIKSLD